MTKQYQSATAFRSALETRLKNIAKDENVDIQKLRRQVSFDRLLLRFFQTYPDELYLKGGYSMELRIQKARATKDIDLILKPGTDRDRDNDEMHNQLVEAARIDAKDFFEFRLHEPTLDLEAVPYGGLRFPVEAHVDGRLFVRFPIDVVISNLILNPIENLEHRNWLEFAGIKSLAYPTISKEQQFAEKLHAYTYPRDKDENSRVKDGVDMFLLIQLGDLDRDFLKQAIKEVFEYRKTHPVPTEIMDPPANWASRYEKLSRECGINKSLNEVITEIGSFFGTLSE
ncbi:MAG: nucleotidyl transferase AbiEii/AbiGii toxin family protein [Verrucomicrobia bacterium]|nr:nucleotidyl transferase AbiEii/AbiGii toxin family protein [Verrucomicrobiota bacterium]